MSGFLPYNTNNLQAVASGVKALQAGISETIFSSNKLTAVGDFVEFTVPPSVNTYTTFRAVDEVSGKYVWWIAGGTFRTYNGDGTSYADDGALPGWGTGSKIKYVRVSGDKVAVYLNGTYLTTTVGTFPNSIKVGFDWYYNAVNDILVFPTGNRDLTVNFSLSNAPYNYGSTIIATDTSTGGSGGTLTRVWKVDGVTVSQSNPLVATFSGLAVGLRTISLIVTDSADTGNPITKPVTIYVGQVTPSAANVAINTPQQFAGSFSGGTWASAGATFTAGDDGSKKRASWSSTGTKTLTHTSDDGTQSESTTVTVFTPPSITTVSPLPGAVIGNNYAQQLATSGGSGSGSWSILTNDPAHPVNLTGGGIVSFNYSVLTTITFTVRYTDSTSGYGYVDKQFQITVAAPPPAPPTIISTSPLKYAQTGKPYTLQLQKAGGAGSGTWTATVGNLPEGALAANGLITIPSVGANNYTFTVRYTDVAGYSEAPLTIPVSALAVWQFDYSVPLERSTTKTVRFFKPIAGAWQTRTDRPAKRKYSIKLNNYSRAELNAIRAFWDENYPSKQIMMWDNMKQEYFNAYITSDLNEQERKGEGDMALTIEEV